MATISKMRRLVNPGKKRKLSPLQKLFFGSKRQRAAVAKKKNPNKKFRKALASGSVKKAIYYGRKHGTRKHLWSRAGAVRKKRNVGSIITVWPTSNPGRRKRRVLRKRNSSKKVVIVNKGAKVATKRKYHRRRKTAVAKVTRRHRRRNYGTVVGRSWSTYKGKGRKRNPGRMKRYSRRRRVSRNPGRRRSGYRRNPGMLTGTAGRVLGVIGGVGVTKLLCGFLPAQLSTGVLGYASTAAIAVLQGKLVGKFSKNAGLGNDMLVGGLAYLTAKILNDFFPSIGSYTGISGMGLIGPSSFYTPQVNQAGSMGAFQVPRAINGAIMASMPVASKGVGTFRRTGRL